MKTEGARRENRSWGRKRWLAGLLLAVAGVASAGLGPQSARGQRPSRDEVEAAYLYNFGKFVRWPAASGRGALVLCVAAPDSFTHALSSLATGEQIDQRPLTVKTVNDPRAVEGCSILYLGSSEPERVDTYLTAASGKPILTVGDTPDFLARGGTIQFVLMQDHIRFSVNLSAASRCGLGLSSELLKVAVSVTGRPGTGGAR
ncbi:MAG TPA: YfiR family protein [Acidobacteriaceae bacterium]